MRDYLGFLPSSWNVEISCVQLLLMPLIKGINYSVIITRLKNPKNLYSKEKKSFNKEKYLHPVFSVMQIFLMIVLIILRIIKFCRKEQELKR